MEIGIKAASGIRRETRHDSTPRTHGQREEERQALGARQEMNNNQKTHRHREEERPALGAIPDKNRHQKAHRHREGERPVLGAIQDMNQHQVRPVIERKNDRQWARYKTLINNKLRYFIQ